MLCFLTESLTQSEEPSRLDASKDRWHPPTHTSEASRLNQLGIFAKHWTAGMAKTRLGASVGMELAAEFHRVCLCRLVDALSGVDARRVIRCWPPESLPAFEALVHGQWDVAMQSPGDLGAKMSAYFRDAFASDFQRVLLIGSDSPLLTVQQMERAFELLVEHDVVLGPSDDGGYYLIGCRRAIPQLWTQIPWSTSSVFNATVTALQRVGARWTVLESESDVDNLSDLRLLTGRLREMRQRRGTLAALRSVCERCIHQADYR